MKSSKQFIYLLLIVSALTRAQSPYSISSSDKTLLLTAGGSVSLLALLMDSKIEPLTREEVMELKRNGINSFDVGATYNYSPAGALASDILLGYSVASPFLFLLTPEIKKNAGEYLLMFAEVSMFTYSTTYIIKSNVQRIRPYAYNEEVPLIEKINTETRRSFFSGHTSFAFASAVFVSETFAAYNPDSKYKNIVRGTALLTAVTTGYLRFYSGKHFPTDIITGAVVGGAIGYLIPRANKSGKAGTEKRINLNFTLPL